MRGRKPQLAAVEGGKTTVPAAPSWLPKEAKAEWRRVMPGLIARRILTDEDFGLVEAYCLTAGQVRLCQAELASSESPFVESDRSAPRPHPAFRVMHSAMAEMRRLGAELGIGPVARQRAAGATEGDDDDLKDFDL